MTTTRPRFETPEQVKVDYLVLSLDTMQQQLTVSENEIKSWYETHKDKYQQRKSVVPLNSAGCQGGSRQGSGTHQGR